MAGFLQPQGIASAAPSIRQPHQLVRGVDPLRALDLLQVFENVGGGNGDGGIGEALRLGAGQRHETLGEAAPGSMAYFSPRDFDWPWKQSTTARTASV